MGQTYAQAGIPGLFLIKNIRWPSFLKILKQPKQVYFGLGQALYLV
jgi:hypothetical protein